MPHLFADAAVTLPTGNEAGWVLGALSMTLTAVFGYLNNRNTGKQADELKEVKAELKGCQEKHTIAEHAASVALAEVAALKKQNGEQQGMIDKLTARIISLVTALRRQGLSAGSGAHPTIDETAEHTPLPVPPPKG